MNDFLVISKEDLKKRNWDRLDIIVVTGDAYVDHSSYGAAIIGRVLEDAGFRVDILAQPDWKRLDDFKKLGRLKLFFGITAGNLDSMLAKYTANKKVRNIDDYSPGGKTCLRPERATLIYTNKLQQVFKNTPIVLGGMEASMRRLAHYDYCSDKVRRSMLLDSKADILVYGMGEKQILEIARCLKNNEGKKTSIISVAQLLSEILWMALKIIFQSLLLKILQAIKINLTKLLRLFILKQILSAAK